MVFQIIPCGELAQKNNMISVPRPYLYLRPDDTLFPTNYFNHTSHILFYN